MLFREMSVTVRFIQMGTSIHCVDGMLSLRVLQQVVRSVILGVGNS